MENIVISNPKELEKSKKSISEGGPEKIHVRADFDGTLTKSFVEGKSIPSLISILHEVNYFTPDYVKKTQELYHKYHPIEINPKISLEKKKKATEEWWMFHFDLLIKLGLKKNDIEKVIDSGKVRLREGGGDFLSLLKTYNIPLIIISSSSLGSDAIPMYLKKEGKLSDNVYVISNSYQWDESGRAVAVNQPIIHMRNKDDTVIRNFPVFDKIKSRKNVLLLADDLRDVGMIKGFDYDNLIKIGFLNENVEENLEYYKSNFDVVILNDYSFDYVNQLLKEVIK